MVVVFLYALIRFAVGRISEKHDFAVFLFGFDFNAVVLIRRAAEPQKSGFCVEFIVVTD